MSAFSNTLGGAAAPTTTPATPPAIQRAGALLRAGSLVAFPTETVYGLGAAALDGSAVQRLFEVKRRPADNPLIVHVVDLAALDGVVAEIPPAAAQLAHRFWPGPLTLVLPAAPGVPRETTAGLDTVAVRVPGHPVALAVLRAARVPVAAPSANRSGRPSPTTAAHVLADLGSGADLIIDGGPTPVGIESTVVDARGAVPVVLREGTITREQLGTPAGAAGGGALERSPGTRHRHYAPDCRVHIADPGTGAATARTLRASGMVVACLATEEAGDGVIPLGRYVDAADLGRRLYGALRGAEDAGAEVVVVEAVPEDGVGSAVMDRLRRASQP